MNITHHLWYVFGAFWGSLGGAFFVHCFDTIAVRKFANISHVSIFELLKNIFISYLPVTIGVVPMRAASFGVYSIAQAMLISFGLINYTHKIMAAIISGICLTALSCPAEIFKTRKQLAVQHKGLTLLELKHSFTPLALRVVPTVTCMLAGTEIIQPFLHINHIVVSTAIASIIAALISQLLGTPSDNLRVYRIYHQDYATKTRNLFKQLKFKRLYAGFFARSLSLGIQAAFTFIVANSMS